MKTDPNIAFACTEEFAELCALATTGALTLEEYARLENHIGGCQKCRTVLAEYHRLASEGMAKLGAQSDLGEALPEVETSWPHVKARNELLEKLRAGEAESTEVKPLVGKVKEISSDAVPWLRRALVQVLGAAAVLVLGLAVGYRLANTSSRRIATPTAGNSGASIEQQLRAVEAQRDALNATLAAIP